MLATSINVSTTLIKDFLGEIQNKSSLGINYNIIKIYITLDGKERYLWHTKLLHPPTYREIKKKNLHNYKNKTKSLITLAVVTVHLIFHGCSMFYQSLQN